jgi:uncharacterized protein YuzE
MALPPPKREVTIDRNGNSMYVYTQDGPIHEPVIRTDSVLPSVLVDLNAEGKVLGVEFLGINRKSIKVDELLEKYATHSEDSPLDVGSAYFLRMLSFITWELH